MKLMPMSWFEFYLSTYQNMLIFHIDIDDAFLNGNLDKTVYLYLPLYFKDKQQPRAVCKLNKDLWIKASSETHRHWVLEDFGQSLLV